ncbi:MAG: hypothetical protein JKP98_25655 [Rhodobacteraceae bacterium]|nr:hypothetical protein [Paracoccaceae bacterium]
MGDDTLRGGKGDDIYRFAIGDGHDVIAAEVDNRVYRHNELHFDTGIAAEDVSVARGYTGGQWTLDLVLDLASGDRVTVERFFEPDWNQRYHEIQVVRFADGTAWDRATLEALRWADPVADGTEDDDGIEGDAADNVFYGHGGADRLDGNAGADTLYGGDGADELYGGFDADALHGGADDDRLFGVQGDDTLDGGAGDDFLNGGQGNDTYRWGRRRFGSHLVDLRHRRGEAQCAGNHRRQPAGRPDRRAVGGRPDPEPRQRRDADRAPLLP